MRSATVVTMSLIMKVTLIPCPSLFAILHRSPGPGPTYLLLVVPIFTISDHHHYDDVHFALSACGTS